MATKKRATKRKTTRKRVGAVTHIAKRHVAKRRSSSRSKMGAVSPTVEIILGAVAGSFVTRVIRAAVSTSKSRRGGTTTPSR